MRILRLPASRLLGMGLALGLACSHAVPAAADGDTEQFVPHATAYAHETNAQVEIDPHVFVEDPNAPDTTGPEGIHHIAGYRPARLADSPNLPLYNANGDTLDLSLGRWLATKGSVQVQTDGGAQQFAFRFSHLIPFGVYSLFLSRSDAGGYSFKPLHTEDGTSTFTASGDGLIHLTAPLDHPRSNQAVLLVYHSDDVDHDEQPGDLGTNAHVQLVLTQGEISSPQEQQSTDQSQSEIHHDAPSDDPVQNNDQPTNTSPAPIDNAPL